MKDSLQVLQLLFRHIKFNFFFFIIVLVVFDPLGERSKVSSAFSHVQHLKSLGSLSTREPFCFIF